jgi:hypothetical protein
LKKYRIDANEYFLYESPINMENAQVHPISAYTQELTKNIFDKLYKDFSIEKYLNDEE